MLDLVSLRKVYIKVDSVDSGEVILKEISAYPDLIIVSTAEEAEFVLEYKVLGYQEAAPSVFVHGILIHPANTTSLMMAYIPKQMRRRVVWSKIETGTGLSSD